MIFVVLIIFLVILYYVFYALIDFIRYDRNKFLDTWAAKTIKLWLPFYALQRLIKEVIFKKW